MTAYILWGCAVAILIGIFTKSWATGRGGDIGVGPLGVEACFQGMCRDVGWGNAKGDIQAVGYLAIISGLAASAACGWIGFLSFSNNPAKFPPWKIVNGAFGLAAFATTFFAIRLLIEDQTSISWSPIFGVGGVVAGGIFVRKLKAYWPGEGHTPWPVATAVAPAPYGAPQNPYAANPYGAPAPQAPPYGAPMGAPPSGPPMGAPPYGAPMGPPPSGPPMGGPPMGGPPMGGPPMGGPPMGAPPMGGPPMGTAPAVPSPPPVNAPSSGAPSSARTVMGMSAPAIQTPAQAQPAAAPQGQFCPRDGAPLEFVAQYQRWFCQKCQQYA